MSLIIFIILKSKDLVRGYGFELNKDQILYKNNKIRGVDLIGDGILIL